MEDLNKITSTRVGDNIHFFVNGAEDSGTVVKMNTSFVTVVKDDGILQDIHINDTFFIKDILVNKTWNDMSMEERTVALHEIHAYSPRFLAKSWQELPRELKEVLENTAKSDDDYSSHTWSEGYKDGKDAGKKQRNTQMEATAPQITNTLAHNVLNNMKYRDDKDKRKLDGLKKSNVEQGHYGSAGRSGQVVETNTDFDAPDDYEGQTEDEKKEQFKHEDKKPETTNKSSRARYGGNQSSGTTLRPNDIKELQELETKKEPPAVATSDTKYFGANGKQITREEHDSSSDIKQSYGSMQEQLWEEWLDKGEGGMGDGSAPANNGSSSTNENGMYNPVYGEKGRHGGQGKDKEEDEDKDDKDKQQ